MAALSDGVSPSAAGRPLVRSGFIRLPWLGYPRYQDLVVGGVVSLSILTAVVALLPMNRYAVLAPGLVLLVAVGSGLTGRAHTCQDELRLFTSGGWYAAARRTIGDLRHGAPPGGALASLRAPEWHRDDP